MNESATNELPELMKVKQVCEALSLSPPTVYRLMESGQLPYVKMGAARRVKKADVLAYVERSTVGRAARPTTIAERDASYAEAEKAASGG